MTPAEFLDRYVGDVMQWAPYKQGREGTRATGRRRIINLNSIQTGLRVRLTQGFCRELCRMWLFVRNTPEVAAGIKGADRGPPELAFLRKNTYTLMVAQATYETNFRTEDDVEHIFGLAAGSNKECKTAHRLYRRLVSNGGQLAMALVTAGGGFHVLAFDMRDQQFVMFDPNSGMYWITRGEGAEAEAEAEEVLREYLLALGYGPRWMLQYTRHR